ncbi:MAG: bifunctional phosphopantothenoylcysteine decarboxylase/phosphopantothenate--cysteine ligase CoaBC, partial [Ginsengibacter sp.]
TSLNKECIILAIFRSLFFMLSGKKILLGITGSIAAYKAILLVRLLIKAGAEVKIILTPSAVKFVSPLTLSTLSKNKVLIDLFEENSWSNHVMLGRWADVFVIAPASCNTISKMANGQCDNLLIAVYLSATSPVFIAPAMDEDMWKHHSTQDNLNRLKKFGNQVIPVANGELASGLFGDGRMAEPDDIVNYIEDLFNRQQELKGIKALITAGPTQENIDPVRYISNRSSGKMGISIAEELQHRGAEVQLVLGPSTQAVNIGINVTRVVTAEEMHSACESFFDESSIIIMAAAVADYSPEKTASQKIKKNTECISLNLIQTKDILKAAGNKKTNKQVLVGFALETENEKANALKKLAAKNADIIVLNSLKNEHAGFDTDTNTITIFDKRGNEYHFGNKLKSEVAKDIVNCIIKYRYE